MSVRRASERCNIARGTVPGKESPATVAGTRPAPAVSRKFSCTRKNGCEGGLMTTHVRGIHRSGIDVAVEQGPAVSFTFGRWSWSGLPREMLRCRLQLVSERATQTGTPVKTRFQDRIF